MGFAMTKLRRKFYKIYIQIYSSLNISRARIQIENCLIIQNNRKYICINNLFTPFFTSTNLNINYLR